MKFNYRQSPLGRRGKTYHDLPREGARAPERKRTRNKNIKISGHRYLINHGKDIASVNDAERVVPWNAYARCFGY